MNDGEEILIVSNSSIPEEKKSYGLLIGTVNRKELAHVSGTAWGTPSLYSSESWKMLEGPILLEQITKYIRKDIKGKRVSVYSDDKSLIMRENERQKYDKNYPSETLRPN